MNGHSCHQGLDGTALLCPYGLTTLGSLFSERRNSDTRAGLRLEEGSWFSAESLDASSGLPFEAKKCSRCLEICVRMNCFACAGSWMSMVRSVLRWFGCGSR